MDQNRLQALLMQASYSPQGQMDADLQQYTDMLNRRRAELDAQRRMQMLGLQDGLQRGPVPQMQPLEPSTRFYLNGPPPVWRTDI